MKDRHAEKPMKNEGFFRPSDLPIIDGKVYHLDLKPEEL